MDRPRAGLKGRQGGSFVTAGASSASEGRNEHPLERGRQAHGAPQGHGQRQRIQATDQGNEQGRALLQSKPGRRAASASVRRSTHLMTCAAGAPQALLAFWRSGALVIPGAQRCAPRQGWMPARVETPGSMHRTTARPTQPVTPASVLPMECTPADRPQRTGIRLWKTLGATRQSRAGIGAHHDASTLSTQRA